MKTRSSVYVRHSAFARSHRKVPGSRAGDFGFAQLWCCRDRLAYTYDNTGQLIGASSASHTYSANNTTDAWSDWSDSGNSSRWESHDSWSQSPSEATQSYWQESYITVTDSAGALTTGDTDASGGSRFVTANHGLSNSTSTGEGYSSQSISNWSAATNAQDNYAYQANWSNAYDTAG